jgi:hypothetical protein
MNEEEEDKYEKQIAALQARIKELETIIKNDDARSRLAFLEQEVARLQALLDRYEVGLEIVTAVEDPNIADGTFAPTIVSQRIAPSTAIMIGKAVSGCVSNRSKACCHANRRSPPLRVTLRSAIRAASP